MKSLSSFSPFKLSFSTQKDQEIQRLEESLAFSGVLPIVEDPKKVNLKRSASLEATPGQVKNFYI